MSFTFLFYKHIMFRKSCEKCHFCNTKRPSDITIADFWGWEKTNKDFNADDKGCSLILINTEKGKKLFDNIKDRMNIIPVDLEKCIQPNMKYPSPPSRNRNKFEQEYSKYGFEYVYYKYGEEGWRYKIFKFFLDIRKKAGKIKRKILK